jgi:AcrR family transcriptional regulator
MVDRGHSRQLTDRTDEVGPSRTRHRAAALPPGERRAAIIDATVPLLIAHGTAITTCQIAEAAAIAEGTIFRVFPDKESLIAAAVKQVFDPAPVEVELRGIDPSLPLESRLEEAVGILQRRFTYIWRLMTVVGITNEAIGKGNESDRRGTSTLRALAAVLEPDRARLRCDPMVAAQMMRGLTFAGTHPALLVDRPLSNTEIVAILLDGIRARPGLPC